MKRVLVTGADGFIGRHCLGRLTAAGFAVEAVSRRAHPPQTGVAWRPADLLRPGEAARLMAESRPTHLLHLAWPATGPFWEARENFDWVSASLELVAAFADAGGRRVVVAGSCAEYDWRHGWCCEALTPLAPATPYGVCKNAVRQLLEAFAGRTDLSLAWARLFFLYGPGEQAERLAPSVIRPLLRGEPAACSEGRQIRDFLHVADAAAAMVRLLDSPLTGAVNVASAQPIAVRDLVLAIAARIGRPDLVRLGARPMRANEPALIVGDNSRLTQDLGWRPRFGLDDGLDDAIGWWRERLDAPAPRLAAAV